MSFGSFTVTEPWTTDDEYLVSFTQDSRPLIYGVFEDLRNYEYMDTSHSVIRVISITAFNQKSFGKDSYYISCTYSESNSPTPLAIYQTTTYTSNDYANSGGIYGAMEISLNDKQVRFSTKMSEEWFLQGRTYVYFAIWA